MKKNKVDEFIIFTPETNRRFVEAIAQLQSNINLAAIDNKYQVIAITSANEDDGKSTLAANLANIYAVKGKKTLIINLDLRKPTLHHFFNVPREKGIVEYCAEDIPLEEIVKKSEYNVDVITSGKHTSFSNELIHSKKLCSLIEKLREEYDCIIIDTPPVLGVSDALLARDFVDGYILVVRENKSKISSVKETIKLFDECNAKIIGCTLVGVSRKHGGHYYYEY